MNTGFSELVVMASGHRHILLGVAAALLPAACGPGYLAPPVSRRMVDVSHVPVSRLERGYQIHQAKCAKCHPFENPASYIEEALAQEIMPTMARKSKLDQADAQAVLEYLLAARKMPSPVPNAGNQ